MLAGHRHLFSVVFRLVGGGGVDQGAGGADLDTGAAKTAAGVLQGFIEGGADNRIVAPLGEADSPDAPGIGAHLHAASAKDTEVIVALDEGLPREINGQLLVCIGKGRFFNADVVHQVLQLTLLIVGAADAPLVDGDVTQADIVGSAGFPAGAGKTGVGRLG